MNKEEFFRGDKKEKSDDEILEVGVLKENWPAVLIFQHYINIDIVYVGFGVIHFKGFSAQEIKSGFELYGLDKDLYQDTLMRIKIMEQVHCSILNEKNQSNSNSNSGKSNG